MKPLDYIFVAVAVIIVVTVLKEEPKEATDNCIAVDGPFIVTPMDDLRGPLGEE